MDKLTGSSTHVNGDVPSKNYYNNFNQNQPQKASQNYDNEYVEDLEDHHMMPNVIPSISNQVSNHVSLSNGHVGGKQQTPLTTNGSVSNGRPNLRSMLHDAEMNSHI